MAAAGQNRKLLLRHHVREACTRLAAECLEVPVSLTPVCHGVAADWANGRPEAQAHCPNCLNQTSCQRPQQRNLVGPAEKRTTAGTEDN